MPIRLTRAVFEEGRKRGDEEGRAVDEGLGALRDQSFRRDIFQYWFGHLELFVLARWLFGGQL